MKNIGLFNRYLIKYNVLAKSGDKDIGYIIKIVYMYDSSVSKFLKSKSAYRAKEAKENTFFEDIQLVSKAVKNNSCQTVIPTTKRDC